jgi:hypothetical protein
MRLFVGLLVALATAGLGQAPLWAQAAPPNYYPLQEGNRWDFRSTVNGQAGNMTFRIAKVEEIDGVKLARLEGVVQGQVVATEHLRTTAEGVFRHKTNGVDVMPPLQVLRFPIKDGETWKGNSTVGTEKLSTTCAVGKDEVTVPAGKFKTVTVKVTFEAAAIKGSTTYWFAEGTGMVKQAIDFPGTTIVLELEKVELKK